MSSQPIQAIYVSRSGLAMCPACVTHFQLESVALTTTTCPFCETTLGVSSRTALDEQGHKAWSRLNRGKSGAMLAALGVSLALAACEQKSPEVVDPEPVPPVMETSTEQGGSAPPTSQPAADMGMMDGQDQGDMSADTAVPVKPAEESVAVPKYGLPPSMMDDEPTPVKKP